MDLGEQVTQFGPVVAEIHHQVLEATQENQALERLHHGRTEHELVSPCVVRSRR
jgi:hypothetical protein